MDPSEAMETDLLSNSDGDSSDSDGEEDEALISRAEELERNISDNKYLYDAHLELVNLYRRLGDIVSMRSAYQRFHEYFPLTPQIWLEWIEVEKKLAVSENEIAEVIKLFETAVQDYISVSLWQEYAQYSIGVRDLKTTREILEKGLNIVGLHTAEGSLLWDTLRELELAHLSLMKKDGEEYKEQLNRIVGIFRRQLSVPLLGMENTYAEWQAWLKELPEVHNIDPKPVEWGYKNALKTLETYKPFEDRLIATQNENELYQIYKEYIKALSDPSTIFCVYERAVAQLCLNPNIWIDYCSYALKFGDKAEQISDRGLRNIPWSEELWIMRLRVLEFLEKDSNEVMQCFEQGMSNMGGNLGLELWLAYLEYNNRTSDDTEKLNKLFEQAIEQLGYRNDANSKIIRWYARILAKSGKMVEARKYWKNLLKGPQNKGSASVWLEFINLERQYGDIAQTRSLYQRALTNCTDWPQFIVEEYLLFERENGKLDDMLKCVETCKEVTRKQQEVAATAATASTTQDDSSQKGKKRKFTNDHEEQDYEAKKTRTEKFPTRKPPIVKDPTTTVFISNLYPSINEKKLQKVFPNAVNIEIVTDRQGKSRCYGYVQFAMEEEVMSALARDRELLDGLPMFVSSCKPDKNERQQSFKYAAVKEENKLFVRGLPVEKTQEDIEQLFKPYGAIAVRLVLHKSGKRKGLAYIEFPDEKTAKKALEATDQMQVGEHTISVAISAPPPKGQPKSQPPPPSATRHSKSRLQLPMIPRALQVKNDKSANGGSSDSAKPQAKSNDDFRKMLLNK